MKKNNKKIELNEDFKEALHLMENTKEHIFLTGKAGTGKSTLLQYFRRKTKKVRVVLAPTGVAAVNVEGQTIHSFFKFDIGITLSKVGRLKEEWRATYKNLDMVIIDEISMVRADLFDCIERFLRLNGPNRELPFGGVQMVLIGDMYQLSPVVQDSEKEIFDKYYGGPYFFNAKAFENMSFKFIELKKIYRQTDRKFVEALNAIRTGEMEEEHLTLINEQVNLHFKNRPDDGYVYLVGTNNMANDINNYNLSQIHEKVFQFNGEIEGNFSEKHLPTPMTLFLKKGAQIMILHNDNLGRWQNGDLGKIVEIEDNSIKVELHNGQIVSVNRYTWKKIRYVWNNEEMWMESETIGSFTQYPMRLAWAVTIHKGQSKTFEKVVIDFGTGTFAFGQCYVALSRCTSLKGLVLKTPIEQRHIFVDSKIKDFMKKFSK